MKEKGLAILISGKKPKTDDEHEDLKEPVDPFDSEDEEEEFGDLESAAEDILSAISANDAAALAEALELFISQCR